MFTAIVFLPLLGALIAGLFGRTLGARPSELLTTGLLFVSCILSWVAFFEVGLGHHPQTVVLADWINSGNFNVSWTIRVDTLTAVMLVVVTSVSALVHLYSIGYMHEDPHRQRFFAYLSLFTFAMLMLVTADNFLQMFFGWEGVGLASYLLIGFWFKKPSANAAAIKAFLVNRVGDFGFALGVLGIFYVFGTLDFTAVFEAAPAVVGRTFLFAGYVVDVLNTICVLLFIGAMGKSAQLFLHTWLPDAMEGPTPVSALIHAATMVTAGVFLVCRCSPLFELAPFALSMVAIVGATTAFFAASVGLFQNDIKRVIAYSTCSQLGYMFFAAGVSAYGAAMFHLFTHAFFKALLFLGAGSVIHAMHHEQDMRNMGGLAKHIRFTWAMMLIGTIAITGLGLPILGIGFSGFYSKDMIIESAYAAHTGIGNYAFLIGIVAACMTSFYSWRLMFMTFHGAHRGAPHHDAHGHDDHAHAAHGHDDHHGHGAHAIHESPVVMLVPLALLAIGAIFAGPVFYTFFVGEASHDFWHGTLALPEHAEHHDFPLWVLFAPLVATLLGLSIAYYYYIRHPELPPKIAARRGMLYLFLYKKWYFDELYDFLFVRPAKALGRILWKQGDGRIIDGLGPDGISARVLDVTRGAVSLQSGYVYHYAFAMLMGAAALVTWFLFHPPGN
jgi:NADH-quinone oxidoreductase subunit L